MVAGGGCSGAFTRRLSNHRLRSFQLDLRVSRQDMSRPQLTLCGLNLATPPRYQVANVCSAIDKIVSYLEANMRELRAIQNKTRETAFIRVYELMKLQKARTTIKA